MIYHTPPDTDYRSEMREAREQASIERGERMREEQFYCAKEECAMGRCKNQCSECIEIQERLRK